MKSMKPALSAKPLVIALQSALATLAVLSLTTVARADDDVARLTNPTNSIEIGGAYTDSSSYQFGQYNGLAKSGVSLIGNVNLRGGNAYGQKPGTMLWSLKGTNLGLSDRYLGGSLSNQGTWELGLSYQQLRHYLSDSYQTPLQGDRGGNTFTMPAGFGLVNEARGSTGTHTLTAAQQAFFQTKDVYSEKDIARFTALHNLGPNWDLRFHWQHVTQSGAKLMGSGSDNSTTTAQFALAGYNPKNEGVQLLMNPTEYKIDNFTLSVDWSGDKGFFTGSFLGSRFRDNYDAVYFSNPYVGNAVANGTLFSGPYPTDMLSTAPNNNNNQIDLMGGYNLTPSTKLVGGYSYGRNTQNAAFTYEPALMQSGTSPVGSLDGLVVNTHADARLTNQTTQALRLSAGVIYNKRDNQTPSNVYPFYTLGGDPASPVNVPISHSTADTDVAGDYRINQSQHLHLDLKNETTKQWCDNTVAVIQGETLAGIPTYYTTTSCAQVPKQSENSLLANYRLNATENLNFNVGYKYADRKSTLNPTFYNPMQSFDEGYENPGFVAYFDASRKRNQGRVSANWQATSALNLSLSGNFADDSYYDSALGVQGGHEANVNLDSSFQASDNTLLTAYATWQWRKRNMLDYNFRVNGSTAKPYYWVNGLRDNAITLGVTAKHDGMLNGKLALAADLSYSLDNTGYSTFIVPGQTTTCNNGGTSGYNCGNVPDIHTEIATLKLTGNYKVDRQNSFLFGYLYQKLNSNDYLYNFYQYGYTSTSTMPANFQNPSYSVNVIFVAYRYAFM